MLKALEVWTDVVTVSSMYREVAVLFRCFMKDDFGARDFQWVSVKVEVS